ncbi:hypothetical protein G4G28_24305 [Massilia sp. Dwa41.01b]|uniref:hypothetical protein n=1 Tax=unclassified Massilia TaxID=2609279 RepID=UPI0015FF8258|nr:MULTISPECIES: hypothetical protein [unclassified Massilia]QNA90845.1 hypothetical protein G4G28_24305 [Massilia sp. Dwa41.01b]QNA98086.1 hypothetical protein G4G31_03405 [Massilia sp. Se16.2.3]
MGKIIETPVLQTESRQLIVGTADLHGLHRKLVGLALLLLLAHCGAMALKYYGGNDMAFGLVPLFDFYEEHNAPTYFSSLNLLITSALLFAISRLTDGGGAAQAKKHGHAWRILAAGFLFMSVDEFADLRMILSKATKAVAGINVEAVPLLSVAWTVPVAAVVALLAVYFIPFLLRLKKVYTINFALAGAAFVFAAIGFETIEGYHVAQTHGVRDVTFMLMVTLEETMEIFSILYFQYFLLRYINEYHRSVYLRLNY